MPIDESLFLIIEIVNTHYEDRHHREWLVSTLISSILSGKSITYKEYLCIGQGFKQAENVNKTVEEIKKENEEILDNFFK